MINERYTAMKETSEQRISRVMREQEVKVAAARIEEARKVREQILNDQRTGAKRG